MRDWVRYGRGCLRGFALATATLLTVSPACEHFDVPPDQSGTYAACCEGAGVCLPQAAIPGERAQMLAKAECGPALLCVPKQLVSAAQAHFDPCVSAATGAEGRCLPRCLPAVAAQAKLLRGDGCSEPLACVPCFDPRSGEATGACTLGDDPGPTQPPVVFDRCCGALGRCVPETLVDDAQKKQLGPDSCPPAQICAPSALVEDPQYVPASCQSSANGAEGRCLPECLRGVKERAKQLRSDGCPAAHLCVPCFDPLSGEATGACTLGADPGPMQSPLVFDRCCGALGRCVPEALVEETQQQQLAADSCRSAQLCVPSAALEDPNYVPASCTSSVNGAEGRCLPACLPDVQKRAKQLQVDGCPAEHLCAPCVDPVSGEATGACNFAADPGPSQPAQTFDHCCGELGRCVPPSLLTDEERKQLGQDSCSSAQLCAPAAALEDENFVPANCTSTLNLAEGRCLPACLPAVAQRASQLHADGCATAQLCAPCFDPVSGAATGACELGADKGPSEPPMLFAHCCSDLGRCIPANLATETQRAQLGADTCSGADSLCAPLTLLTVPPTAPASCRDPVAGAEGRCLPACLEAVRAQGDRLRQANCATGDRCVLCYDPITGADTGACSLTTNDAPREPKYVFDSCCPSASGALGVCLPAALVPSGSPQLPQLTCQAGDVCAPRSIAADANAKLPACISGATTRGACLPRCLLTALQSSVIPQGNCPSDSGCVPCDLLGSAANLCP